MRACRRKSSAWIGDLDPGEHPAAKLAHVDRTVCQSVNAASSAPIARYVQYIAGSDQHVPVHLTADTRVGTIRYVESLVEASNAQRRSRRQLQAIDRHRAAGTAFNSVRARQRDRGVVAGIRHCST